MTEYRLSIGRKTQQWGHFNGYISKSDDMRKLNGLMLSTYDHDNDHAENSQCANSYCAGFWFDKCYVGALAPTARAHYIRESIMAIAPM